MCVMSMVMEHYDDKWSKIVEQYSPQTTTVTDPQITQEEVAEFKELLERARCITLEQCLKAGKNEDYYTAFH